MSDLGIVGSTYEATALSSGAATIAPPRPRRTASTAVSGRVLTGEKEVSNAVEALIRQSNRDLVMLCPRYVDRAPEFRTELIESAVQRGVRVRALWSLDIAKTSEAKRCAAVMRSTRTCPRMLAHVPVRAVLVDNTVAIVYQDPRQARIERTGRAVESLAGMARQLWDRSTEASESLWEGGSRRESGNRHEVVLRLLSDGLTDDAVARRLGVSVRTVRNDVAAAMSALGARSRFQAGVQAARLGLI